MTSSPRSPYLDRPLQTLDEELARFRAMRLRLPDGSEDAARFDDWIKIFEDEIKWRDGGPT